MIGGDGADRYRGSGDETVDGEVVMIWKRTRKQTEKTLYSVRVRVEFRVNFFYFIFLFYSYCMEA